ncbi:MAG: heparinase II/III family protein [Candidatus Promineifilaceae bacterium]
MRLFSTAVIGQAKQKMESTIWADEGWQALAQRVVDWQQQSGQIPAEAGGWIHNYICPEHWEPLVYDGRSPHQHRCPAGHVCTGEKYDAAWRVWRHRQIADLARDAALAYVVLGLDAGRETAVSILTQYANFYTQFDGQADAESWMLKGHAFNQALTEALWAVPVIHAYDLVADTLTAEQDEQLKRDLWKPLTAVMTRAQDNLIAQGAIHHNYMAWINAALGCLGFALADQSLINRAVQLPAGFTAHLDQAILADGLEFEGSPYYHNFVLLADLILAEAARANDINLYEVVGAEGQTLVTMGCAFAKLAWPDSSIPDLAEGSYWQDSIYDPEIIQVFEILYAVQPKPIFARTLNAAYRRRGAARDNWAALLYGRDEVDGVADVSPVPSTHTLLKESGIAVLRSEKKLAAVVVFGPYRGPHHHHDRLSLPVWPFSRDAGSPLYALPARKAWYPHSYAHNTLVVDGRPHANCGGELIDWNGRCLTTAAPDAYPGIRFERTTEIKDGAILDELIAAALETHTFDWVFHLDGVVELPADLQPLTGSLADEGAAAYIELFGQKVIQQAVSLEIAFDSDVYRLTLGGERPFTLLLGTAPGTTRYPRQKRVVVIGRTIGTSQRYHMTISQN